MLLAILPILGALVPFILNAITKRQELEADPKTKNQKAYEHIDTQILSRNSTVITAGSNADLDELERLQRSASADRVSR